MRTFLVNVFTRTHDSLVQELQVHPDLHVLQRTQLHRLCPLKNSAPELECSFIFTQSYAGSSQSIHEN